MVWSGLIAGSAAVMLRVESVGVLAVLTSMLARIGRTDRFLVLWDGLFSLLFSSVSSLLLR